MADRMYIGGFLWLGIALSIAWLIAFPCTYVLVLKSFHSHPQISYTFRPLFAWTEGNTGHTTSGELFTPIIPHADLQRFFVFRLGPVFVGWLVFFILPWSIRWVKDGFLHER